MNVITQTLLPTFLIILVGYLIGKKRKVDLVPFTDLIIYITGPALIIFSIAKSTLDLKNAANISISSFLVILGMGTITAIILKLTKSKKRGLYLPITVGNTGFLGLPLALFAFGNEGLARAIVYDITNAILIFTVGIYLISNHSDFKEVFKIPLIYAAILGVILNLTKTTIPSTIATPLEMIGLTTIPLALMILGYNLTKIKITSLKTTVGASLLRILGGFTLAFIITSFLGLQGIDRGIVLILAAQPSSMMSMILCKKYDQDAELAASIVFVSTLISIITIPLILTFVQ
ncbi:MAG: AEC family transporter [Nanoarchaeota archaeon]|nr:AEC family transporter [Nanoarchaeota archaeon]